jgi:uncharacterized membrane protein
MSARKLPQTTSDTAAVPDAPHIGLLQRPRKSYPAASDDHRHLARIGVKPWVEDGSTISAYALSKLVHVVAVVLFLGNASHGLFWVAHAEKAGDPRIIGHAMQGVICADRWFTTPGVILIIASGIAAAITGGLKLLSVGWILGSIGMFSLSGLVFGLALAPLQRQIVSISASATDPQALQEPLRR